MKRTLAVLAALTLLALAACTDPDVASRNSLAALGFTDIQTEWTFTASFNCSERDDWARDFTATGVNGQPVSGTVCGGYIGKGATVRFD
ncbi:hypothetical protein [Novosphingobium lindaniclasticum]|uniref:Lipoprotein n=1 Tax=Novosphingobium lindaniclasticum LE124 TaxID=1096930 RepID=T0IFF2_9SPHN|nr:hypothetical protein [Novosphingobium lindaniclasticum]EQB10410.1 hypothetical protein L284_17105 [Novosphingobium lindaniclasticum LE124]